MSTLNERIGDALLSNGQHDIIRAESKHEEDLLTNAGFTKIGSMKEGDNIIAIFKIEQKTKEVLKIVEVPKKENSWPYNDKSYPFGRPEPDSWYYNPNNPMYSTGTSTGDATWMQYKGTTVSNRNDVDYSVSAGLYELGLAMFGNTEAARNI